MLTKFLCNRTVEFHFELNVLTTKLTVKMYINEAVDY